MLESILKHLLNLREHQTLLIAIAERSGFFLAGALLVAIIWKYTSRIKEHSQNFDKYASKLESILKQKDSGNVKTLANTVLYTQHLSQRINAKWNRSITIISIQLLCLGSLTWATTQSTIPSCLLGGAYMIIALVVLFISDSIYELYTLRIEKSRLEKIFEQPLMDDQITEILCTRKYPNN